MVQLIPHIFFQVLLESIPVSSSGHVTFFNSLMLFLIKNKSDFFIMNESIDFLLHIPTLFIVGIFFFSVWWGYLKGLLRFKKEFLFLALWCIVADSITIVWYLFFCHYSKGWFPLPCGFVVTGALLYSLTFIKHNTKQQLTLKNGCALGFVQGIALLPGISRFGSTFVAARWLGFSRQQSFEYSFLIQWPLLVAAIVKGLYSFDRLFVHEQLITVPIILSIVISAILSYAILCWVAQVVKRGSMWKFCWYLWGMGIVSGLFFYCF